MHSVVKVLVKAIFLVVLSAVHCSSAFGQVSVDRVIIDFKPNESPVTNLVVRNSSPSVLYVKTESYNVERPGEADEKHVPTDRLLISPKRFSVPANGERTVRLLLRDKPGEVEGVFRASFMPVSDESGLEGLSSGQQQKPGAILRVLTGMGILVFAAPRELKPNLTVERGPDRVTIANAGNINVFIDQLRICEAGGKQCKDYPAKRMYPGNKIDVSVPADSTFSFRKYVNQEFSNVNVPATRPNE